MNSASICSVDALTPKEVQRRCMCGVLRGRVCVEFGCCVSVLCYVRDCVVCACGYGIVILSVRVIVLGV